MLDRLLSLIPGSRASRGTKPSWPRSKRWAVLRPATDPVAMERAIQQIVQIGRTETGWRQRTECFTPLPRPHYAAGEIDDEEYRLRLTDLRQH